MCYIFRNKGFEKICNLRKETLLHEMFIRLCIPIRDHYFSLLNCIINPSCRRKFNSDLKYVNCVNHGICDSVKTVLFRNQFLECDDLDTLGLLLRSFWQSLCFILCQDGLGVVRECQGYPVSLFTCLCPLFCIFDVTFIKKIIFSIFGGFENINKQINERFRFSTISKHYHRLVILYYLYRIKTTEYFQN